MSDRKSKKKGKTEAPSNKMTKEEDSLARFIRFNCATNSTMFEGNEVHYFSGKKAVDLLVDSKKYGAKAKVPKFNNDIQAEDFLQSLLEKGLFFRAKKVVLKKKDKNEEKKKVLAKDNQKSPKSPKPKVEKAKDKVKEAVKEVKKPENYDQDGEENEEEAKDEGDKKVVEQEKQEEEKKKKKKVKLIAHDIQTFVVDPSDVYVWIFDPTPFFKKMIGLMMVLGTIAGCLFPLWPDWLRLGIYYLSVTGIALFGVLLGLALARTILFGLIYACTLGRHKLWVLPNLTEDCGFFESFKPFYTYEYNPGGAFGPSESSKKKSKDKKKSEKTTAVGDEKTEEPKASTSSKTEEKEQLLKEKKDEKEKNSPKTNKKNLKEEKEVDDEKLTNDESSEQEEDEEDENHPSDEISEESDECSSGNASDISQSETSSPKTDKLRRRKKDNKAINKNSKGDGSPTGDDDFVMVDSNANSNH